MWVHPRGEAEKNPLIDPCLLCQLLQQRKLVKVVHHNPTNAAMDSQLQLLSRLIVAMKIDLLHGEAHRSGDGKLPARDHIKPKALFLENLR